MKQESKHLSVSKWKSDAVTAVDRDAEMERSLLVATILAGCTGGTLHYDTTGNTVLSTQSLSFLHIIIVDCRGYTNLCIYDILQEWLDVHTGTLKFDSRERIKQDDDESRVGALLAFLALLVVWKRDFSPFLIEKREKSMSRYVLFFERHRGETTRCPPPVRRTTPDTVLFSHDVRSKTGHTGTYFFHVFHETYSKKASNYDCSSFFSPSQILGSNKSTDVLLPRPLLPLAKKIEKVVWVSHTSHLLRQLFLS